MSRKLISDLYRLLRAMFVTCVIFAISTRNAEETFAGIVLCFLKLTFVVFTLFRQKIPFFFQMFSIQYFFLDPKRLRFPCCLSFFGQRIG